MGFLKDAFSFLTGGSNAADKVVDGVYNGLDKLVLTDEERKDYQIKGGEMHLRMLEITCKESTASSIARRMICVPIVWTWLALLITYVAIDMAPGAISTVAIKEVISHLGTPVLASLGFYVGNHIVGNIKGKK